MYEWFISRPRNINDFGFIPSYSNWTAESKAKSGSSTTTKLNLQINESNLTHFLCLNFSGTPISLREIMGGAIRWALRPGVISITGIFMTYYVCSHQWLSLSTIAVASAVILFFLMVWNWYLWPKLFSPLRRLPGPDGGHWLMGQLANIFGEDPGVTMLQW
jgi:hypothetical protein